MKKMHKTMREAFTAAMEKMEIRTQVLIDHSINHHSDDKSAIVDLELVKLVARYNIDNEKDEGHFTSFLATCCTLFITKPQLWFSLQEAFLKSIINHTMTEGELNDVYKRYEK